MRLLNKGVLESLWLCQCAAIYNSFAEHPLLQKPDFQPPGCSWRCLGMPCIRTLPNILCWKSLTSNPLVQSIGSSRTPLSFRVHVNIIHNDGEVSQNCTLVLKKNIINREILLDLKNYIIKSTLLKFFVKTHK